jgi:hypothetical protein
VYEEKNTRRRKKVKIFSDDEGEREEGEERL